MNTLRVSPDSSSFSDLSFLWLEITAKCNLECVHCYAESSPRQQLFGEMGVEQWLAILFDGASLGCQQVQFIGGEPTLHPSLARMISFAAAQDYKFIEVFTNATNIHERLLQVFIQHGVHVAFSFYSDNPETHDAITKHRGSFERTVATVHRLLDANLPVRAGIIEMQENLGHGNRARLFLERLGVRDIKIDLQRGIGRAAKAAEQSNPMDELCGECWKGKLCVTSAGRVYPCVFSRFADLGSAKDGIWAVLTDSSLTDFRARLRWYRKKAQIDPGTQTDCNPKCSPCSPDEFKECRPSGAPCVPTNLHLTKQAGEEQRASDRVPRDLGCGPTCSPCPPEVFKKCMPARCGPTDCDAAINAEGAKLAGPTTLQCAPACSPNCSPCPPGEFRCAPGKGERN